MDCLCNKKYSMAGYDACLQRFYYGVETSKFGQNKVKGQTRIYTGKDNGAKKIDTSMFNVLLGHLKLGL